MAVVFGLQNLFDRHVAVVQLLGCTLLASLVSVPHGKFLERSRVSTRQNLQHVDPIPEWLCLLNYNLRIIFDHCCLKDAETLERSLNSELLGCFVIQDFLHLKELLLCIITVLEEDGY